MPTENILRSHLSVASFCILDRAHTATAPHRTTLDLLFGAWNRHKTTAGQTSENQIKLKKIKR